MSYLEAKILLIGAYLSFLATMLLITYQLLRFAYLILPHRDYYSLIKISGLLGIIWYIFYLLHTFITNQLSVLIR